MAFEEIAQDVARIPLGIVNVYMVGTSDAWTLVDAGTPNKEDVIKAAAAEHFGEGARPEAIVLTHGHFDHAGSAVALADEWGVPILAHELELPYLDGRSDYPPPDPTVGGFMSQIIRLYGNKMINLGDRVEELDPDEEIPAMEDWEILETPGHTPGHVSFFRASDRALIAGDAFSTTNQDNMIDFLTKRPVVWRPPTFYTSNWDDARRSVKLLASLRPNVLAAGHGVPMSGKDATSQLRQLARNFPIPEHGRYVTEPAIANEDGVVYLPPPQPDPYKWSALGIAGAAALALGGAAVARNRRRREQEEYLNRAA